MWGSRVGEWDTSATVSVSFACALAGPGAAASAVRARAVAIVTHRFIGFLLVRDDLVE
jgi:hypothetical protein